MNERRLIERFRNWVGCGVGAEGCELHTGFIYGWRFWTWIDELSTSENEKSVEDGIHRMGRVVEVVEVEVEWSLAGSLGWLVRLVRLYLIRAALSKPCHG